MNPRTAVLGPFESHVRFANRGSSRMKYHPISLSGGVGVLHAAPNAPNLPQGSTIAGASGIVGHFNLGSVSALVL